MKNINYNILTMSALLALGLSCKSKKEGTETVPGDTYPTVTAPVDPSIGADKPVDAPTVSTEGVDTSDSSSEGTSSESPETQAPPTWSSTVDSQSLAAGEILSLSAVATDSNTDETVSYALDRGSMTCDDGFWSPSPYINSSTGAFVGRPTGSDIGTCTVNIIASSGGDTISQNFTVTVTASTNPVSSVNISAPSVVIAGTCTAIIARSLDAVGTPAAVGSDETISMVVNNGSGSFYSDDNCSSVVTSTTIANGTYESILYFSSLAAPQSLTFIATSPSYSNGFANVSVGSTPSSLLVESAPQIVNNTCEEISISRIDANGNKVPASNNISLNLSQNGNLKFYSNSLCTSEISTSSIESNEAGIELWVKNASLETVTITASDASASLSADTADSEFVSNLSWWDSSWARRIGIQISNLDQSVDLNQQVVRIKLDASRIDYNHFMDNGEDIRFVADDHTTVLSHEIDVWDTNGESHIWVNVPVIRASSSENYIYLYYGNSVTIDAQNVEDVWNQYSSVWHLGEDPGSSGPQFKDSTASARNGSAENSPASTAGIFGNGVDMTGDDDVIDVGDDLSAVLGYSSTFSAWLKTTQLGDNTMWRAPGITGVEGAGNSNDIFFGWIDASGYLGVTAGNGAAAKSNFVVNDNVWRHVTVTRNHLSGEVQFFVNGVLNGSGFSEAGAKTLPFSKLGIIGDTGGTPMELDGYLEEVRIYNTVKSNDQIKADYKYMTDTYFIYGTSETL